MDISKKSLFLMNLILDLQKSKSFSTTQNTIQKTEEKKHKDWLKQEHKTLLHKTELLKRKIQAVKETREECFAALKVVDYLELHPDNITFKSLALDIRDRVDKALYKNSYHKLYELELKKESIEMLKLKIEAKIKP